MKIRLSKRKAQENIKEFFDQKKELDSNKTIKIKRLAMAHNIKLGDYRKIFCKKCYGDLRICGRNRIKDKFRIVECLKCGYKSRWKINSS